MPFKIQTAGVAGWQDLTDSESGEVETYGTRAQAQAEVRDICELTEAEPNEYRVVPLEVA